MSHEILLRNKNKHSCQNVGKMAKENLANKIEQGKNGQACWKNGQGKNDHLLGKNGQVKFDQGKFGNGNRPWKY